MASVKKIPHYKKYISILKFIAAHFSNETSLKKWTEDEFQTNWMFDIIIAIKRLVLKTSLSFLIEFGKRVNSRRAI